MEKTDLRKLDESARYAFRKRAITLIKSGMKKKEVAKLLGVNKNSITDWWKLYQQLGLKGLKGNKCGVKSEDKKRLTDAQEKHIQSLIIDTMPDQLKLDYALWTRKAVKELVVQEFGIELALNTMGDYLRKWGYTPQKPKKRAYEQCSKQVKKWLDETYPAIEAQAKEEGAIIHWGDETGVKNQCNHGRSYAPQGKTPVKKSMAKKFSVNMISTVTNQGKVQFMIYTDRMNADKLIEFMQQLIKSSEKKIYLLLDNLRVHHANIVKAWVEEHQDEIALFYLPSYSPEKNPDEYLNCDLKQGLSDTKAPKDKESLQKNMENHMALLQNNPERVRRYFNHPDIKYAA